MKQPTLDLYTPPSAKMTQYVNNTRWEKKRSHYLEKVCYRDGEVYKYKPLCNNDLWPTSANVAGEPQYEMCKTCLRVANIKHAHLSEDE